LAKQPVKKTNRNQDLGVKAKSDSLSGISLALGVCGGIAAVETVKLARELRRHGAKVTAYLSPTASNFITPTSLEWACGEPVIQKAQPSVDHLDAYDLVLVAPATLNSMAKAATAVCDNVVLLLVASQFGRKAPIIFVPTMNEQLARHPHFSEVKKRLEGWGADFTTPAAEEGRWKMPATEVLVAEVIKLFEGKR
jgi:phosphopantothenoylcysteine decarboxylase/phosphopantothenate--cysteine ligase